MIEIEFIKDSSGTFQVADVLKREDYYIIKCDWHSNSYVFCCYHLNDKLSLNFASSHSKYGLKLKKLDKDAN